MRNFPCPFVIARLALSAFAFLSVGCPENRRDAHCSPDEASIETSEDCIYSGLGKGPKVVEDVCPAEDGDMPTVCPSFAEVLEILVDPKRGDCANAGCHGVEETAALGIFLPADSASTFYATLTDTSASVGKVYVDKTEPANSWIICNLLGEPGGGFPMPPAAGLPNPDDALIVRNWILCGAENN